VKNVSPLSYGDHMLIDCDSCLMDRTDACADCVVSVLLADGPIELAPIEERALGALADAGLVPRLRLIANEDGDPPRAVSA
jgi:hypothetical protein